MAQVVCSSFCLSPKSFGWRTLFDTKAFLPLSHKKRLIYVRAKIDGASSGLGDKLQIRREIDHNAVASSCTQTYEAKPFPLNTWGDDFIVSLVTRNQETMDYNEKRVEKLVREIKDKFNSIEDGEISPSSYDTAWVARVPAIDGSHKPQFPQTLNWIIDNQLRDGSWAKESVFLTSDRILSTLACVISLTIWNTNKRHVQRGLDFIRRDAEQMMEEIKANGTSKVFEMVFPTLLNEASAWMLM